MKKVLCIVLGALLVVLAGCGAVPQSEKSVVATIFPPYDFLRAMNAGQFTLTMLLPPGGEAHGFEPSMEDLARIEGCDFFVYGGGESDGWVEDLLHNCDTSRMTVIRLLDCVEPVVGDHEHHHHEGEEHPAHEWDEHVWTTPENALKIAEVLYEGLQTAFPQEDFSAGYQALRADLVGLAEDYHWLYTHNQNTLVVADRFPFLYLTEAYGLSYQAAFSGCTSDTEADMKTLYELTKVNSPVVFYTEFSNGVLADTVCGATGAQALLWHSCHNVTQEEWEQGVTYVALMQQNLVNLKEALS